MSLFRLSNCSKFKCLFACMPFLPVIFFMYLCGRSIIKNEEEIDLENYRRRGESYGEDYQDQ